MERWPGLNEELLLDELGRDMPLFAVAPKEEDAPEETEDVEDVCGASAPRRKSWYSYLLRM